MTTKPHKEYSELVELLLSRGMSIADKKYAEKKLSQVGYYRLSDSLPPFTGEGARRAEGGVVKFYENLPLSVTS